MSKSIQMRTNSNEKVYPHPYYPVGSIYLSTNDTNPSKWFGGEWQLIAQGMTLVGVDPNDNDFKTPKKTGGEKTHKLKSSELPETIFDVAHICYGEHTEYAVKNITVNKNGGNDQSYGGGWEGSASSGIGTRKAHRYSFGGDQSHNNMPPYFTCYIWCRIA